MPDWIIATFGESLGPIVWVVIVAALVCLLAVATLFFARKMLGGRMGLMTRAAEPRIAVTDAVRVDEKRRLLLIRRDAIEHLILVGGQSELVVETNIAPASAPAEARREPASARREAPSWLTATLPGAGAGDSRSEPAARQPHASASDRGSTGRVEPQFGAEAAPPPATQHHSAPEAASEAPREAAEPRVEETSTGPESEAASRPAAGAAPETPARPEPAPVPAPPARAGADKMERETGTAGMGQQTPIADRARAALRASINKVQSPTVGRATEAAAPSAALGGQEASAQAGSNAPSPTRPERSSGPSLSVRSFASAIQNRKAPDEMPQTASVGSEPRSDTPRAAPAPRGPVRRANHRPAEQDPADPQAFLSDSRDHDLAAEPAPDVPDRPTEPPAADAPASPPAAASGAPQGADPEPSLEEFLSAELDSNFAGDPEWPTAEPTAPLAPPEPAPTPRVEAEPRMETPRPWLGPSRGTKDEGAKSVVGGEPEAPDPASLPEAPAPDEPASGSRRASRRDLERATTPPEAVPAAAPQAAAGAPEGTAATTGASDEVPAERDEQPAAIRPSTPTGKAGDALVPGTDGSDTAEENAASPAPPVDPAGDADTRTDAETQPAPKPRLSIEEEMERLLGSFDSASSRR